MNTNKLEERLKTGWPFLLIGISIPFFLLYLGLVPTSFSIGPLEFGKSGNDSLFPRETNVPIAIDAQKDWQPAGVTLTKGDRFSVAVAGGQWTPARGQLSQDTREKILDDVGGLLIFVYYMFETSGEGTVPCVDLEVRGCPLPENPVGQLVGKIGSSGPPFAIGAKNSFVATDNGMLYLRINDGDSLEDNGGVLAVSVTR